MTREEKAGDDANATGAQEDHTGQDDGPLGVWRTIAAHSRRIHGRRVGFSFSTTAAWMTTALLGLWIAGTMLSGFTNRSTIAGAADTASKLSIAQDPTKAALTLDALQKQARHA